MKISDNFKLLWWAILIITLGLYLFFRQEDLLNGKPTYFDTVVFLVWVAVGLAPIFKDMKIFGLHLKQDIDELKKDFHHQLSLMKVELQSSIEVSSSNNNHVHINGNNPIPAADAEIPEIKRQVAETLKELGVNARHPSSTATIVGDSISRDNVELFKVRYSFEKLLNNYTRLNGIDSRKYPMSRTLRMLANEGVISQNLTHSILEVIAICNYATHGEDISKDQQQFVHESAYGLYEALKLSLKTNV